MRWPIPHLPTWPGLSTRRSTEALLRETRRATESMVSVIAARRILEREHPPRRA